MPKFLTVIVPTCNRKEKLKMVLDSLSKQTYPQEKFEVLVIDDGSKDGTEEMVKSSGPSLNLRYFKGENRGANAARNRGIREAKGEMLLFIGDDIILDSRNLEEHMNYHHKFSNIVVRGDVRGWSDFRETPFRKYMNRRYEENLKVMRKQKDNLTVPHSFSAGNSSLPRKTALEVSLFDEGLKKYGWQDVEFSYRLRKKIKIKFNENAFAYHYHYVDFETFCERMVQIGRGAVVVWRKHPELKIFLGLHFLNFGIDKIFFPFGKGVKLIKKIVSFAEKKNLKSLLYVFYNLLFNHYYLKGVKEILKRK